MRLPPEKRLFRPNLIDVKRLAMAPMRPKALGVSQEQVEELVDVVLDQFDLKAPVDPFALAAMWGGEVRKAADRDDGVLLNVCGRAFEVLLSNDVGPCKDRMDVAQALGHWVLHYVIPNQRDQAGLVWMQASVWENGAAGREALWFAHALMMPLADVVDQARRWPTGDATAQAEAIHQVCEKTKMAPRTARLRLEGLARRPVATESLTSLA